MSGLYRKSNIKNNEIMEMVLVVVYKDGREEVYPFVHYKIQDGMVYIQISPNEIAGIPTKMVERTEERIRSKVL